MQLGFAMRSPPTVLLQWLAPRPASLFLVGSLPCTSEILLAGLHASIRSILLLPLVTVPQALPGPLLSVVLSSIPEGPILLSHLETGPSSR